MFALSDPSASAGGMSSTIGPTSFVSMNVMKYSVSGFGVSVWLCQSSGLPQKMTWFCLPGVLVSISCSIRS